MIDLKNHTDVVKLMNLLDSYEEILRQKLELQDILKSPDVISIRNITGEVSDLSVDLVRKPLEDMITVLEKESEPKLQKINNLLYD